VTFETLRTGGNFKTEKGLNGYIASLSTFVHRKITKCMFQIISMSYIEECVRQKSKYSVLN
jgi:hypothetical protein